LNDETLSATFQAVADPTRRTILARLAQGEATVQELARPLPMSQPAVSKHLKVLEKAGSLNVDPKHSDAGVGSGLGH